MNNILYNKNKLIMLHRGRFNQVFLNLIALVILVIYSVNLNAQSTFDLALQIYPTNNTPVVPGQIASFTIKVHNQGTIAASNVKVVDYLPTGLGFVSAGNTGWSSIGNKVITTIGAIIPAGGVHTLTLNLQLKSTATPHNIANYAEIALTQDGVGNDTTGDDVDSTPDTNPSNDSGAKPFTNTDDFLQGNGIQDEDDHDVALLIICTQNSCNDNVNISLNAACSIEIQANMIVENPDYPNGAYTVILEDEAGNILPSNMVDGSFVGQTLKITAFLPGCESDGCWGYGTIEDKFAINLICKMDTVDCGESDPLDVGLPLAPGTDYYPLGDNFIIPGNNNCSDIVLSYEDYVEMQPCQTGSPFVIKITRTWLAIDGQGNEATCSSMIFVRKGNISDVVGPPDFGNSNPLQCGQFPELPNGNPDPIFTGFPSGISCPNIIAVYEDLVLDNDDCEGRFDVIREWTIVDWCNSQDTTFVQIIKIMDNISPTCASPSEFFGSSYNGLCKGAIDVVNPTITDNCSSFSFTIAYKPFISNDANYNNLVTTNIVGEPFDYRIEWLPVGKYRIAYFVTDACGNTSSCLGTFTIRDNQDPTPKCIISTEVTLDQFGSATLNASFFDDGSFDNCEIDKFLVSKMVNKCGGSNSFKSSVSFCCAESGGDVMVIFRVFDKGGNFNDCMIAVKVIDDQIPTIICPNDLTFTCSQYDQYNQNIPLYIGGEPLVSDNCVTTVTHFDTKAFNNCGVGLVVRNWVVVDGSGNKVTCKQVFEIESDFQFDVNMVQWPADTEVNQCINDEIDPDATGLPILPNISCSNFSIDFIDKVVQTSGAGCGIVERTFTITDNCALDDNNNSFSYVQEIEVYESEDPVFSMCDNKTVIANNTTCSGFFTYIAEATDNCSPASKLVYSYTIDLYDNGTIEITKPNSNKIDGSFPQGTHRVVFRVKDQCGNEGTCAFKFTVVENKNPTPICLPISVTLDEEGQVEVWASDFNLKSFDNCTDELDLVYSFSTDINDQVRTYDCNDIENGISTVISVQMHVWDLSGNYDYCTVNLTITDTQDYCQYSGTLTARIEGKVMVMNNLADFPGVEVMVKGDKMLQKMNLSNISGDYTFSDLSLYDNYTVRPFKNDDALNGVTTLDIVKIQKHILGIDVLTTKEQLIAADVNNSESISGTDLIQLRKLILGKYVNDILPNNTSWRFMADNFTWNADYPFTFPEEIIYENFIESKKDAKFYAIKVGDINGSALVNFDNNQVQIRTSPSQIFIDNQILLRNQTILIPVYASFSQNVAGMQFALNFNNQKMSISKISSPSMEITEDNFYVIDNTIYVSWDKQIGIEIKENDLLFVLEVESKIEGLLEASDIAISEDFKTEIFDNLLNVNELELNIRTAEPQLKATQLFQNEPNPFSQKTIVPFVLDDDQEINIYLHKVDGSLVQHSNAVFNKGENRLEFNADTFPSSGIYYLTLETNSWSTTIKMIKIE